MIYADNAATTRMSRAAIQKMTEVMEGSFGNPSSLYAIGREAKVILEQARDQVASVIHAQPGEILFTSGGTEADNQAVLSAADLGREAGKMHIVSSAFEHHAVLHSLQKLQREGFDVTLLDVHEDGIIRPAELESAIREDTCLVTIMTANNEIGTIQPVREIGRICRRRSVLFHTDAVQAVGHIPVDVTADQIDLLSASAHKFHGPKGVGFLYARKGIRLSGLLEGGAQERGLRAGTENVPGIAAMAVALQETAAAMPAVIPALSAKRDRLIRGLLEIPDTVLNGDPHSRLPGNVNVSFAGISAEPLLLLLDQKGIQASSGSACTSGALDPSHVLLALGCSGDEARGSLRLTLGEDISDRDVGQIITAVSETVQHLREYIDRYDKNVTEEEINYYIKEQMKGYHAIKSRGRIPGRKK